MSHDPKTIASNAAAYAHEAYFSSRHGTLPCDSHSLVYYNNNPTSGDEEERERTLAAVVIGMKARGFGDATHAEYADGYTVSLVWTDLADSNAAEDALAAILAG